MNLYQQNLPNHHLTTQTALISLPTYQPTLANIGVQPGYLQFGTHCKEMVQN
jgi:hypothetical protein